MRVLGAIFCVLAFCAAGPAWADRFDFSALKALIAERRIADVEGLIEALPEDLRRHYTLVFSSRSLQEATYQSPRAVLFGSQAQLIVSFNGDPQERGFAAVETMDFDASTNKVVFREITFAPADAGGGVLISAPNPARCVACHDDPARPIWDLPPSWPGVYGERYGARLSAPELRGMRRFLAAQPTHPRYRHLLDAGALAERDTYVASSRQSYAGVTVEPPNARLSALLSTINTRAILSQLAARPGFKAHLDLLLAAAGSQCGDIAEFYPLARQNSVGTDFRRFAALAASADRRGAAAKDMRRATSAGAYFGGAGPVDRTAVRYVAEQGLEISTQHWTLALERGTYDLTSPSGAPTLEQGLFAWAAREDPELRLLAPYRSFNSNDEYCAHLRNRSRASLTAWYDAHPFVLAADASRPTPSAQPPSAPPALLQRCVACHEGGIAPALPFSHPDDLAARLIDGAYPRGRLLDEILYRLTPQAGAGRMPRGFAVDAPQQRELEDYFVGLARSRTGAAAPTGGF